MSSGGESWLSMTVIEKVRFIHRSLFENRGMRSHELAELEIARRTDTAFYRYCLLASRTGPVWRRVNKIFNMWVNGEVKGQKTGIEDDVQMKLTQWQHMQGINDDTIIINILEKVVRKKFSLQEMGEWFVGCKLICSVQQALVRALREETRDCVKALYLKPEDSDFKRHDTWDMCQIIYPEHATDDAVEIFVPLFKDWKYPTKKKRSLTSALTEFPDEFNAHIEEARTWAQNNLKYVLAAIKG